MIDDPPTTTLMTRAADGDKQAWDALVERYTPLVWSICRRHQLGSDQAGDVGQAVWLKLGKHLGDIHNPAALAGWLAITTRRECSRVRRAARPAQATGNATAAETIPDEHTGMAGQELMMLPGMFVSAIGSTVLGIALVRSHYTRKLTPWLLTLAFPSMLIIPIVLGYNSLGMVPLIVAWGVTGIQL